MTNSHRIPETTIQQIKDRADIVAIVGGYVQLKRSGANNKGCCPFHQEKTPSFNVNSARQIFHCFGCGVGGDVIEFVQKIEGLDFPAAARLVADRAGVDIPTSGPAPRQQDRRLTTPQPPGPKPAGWQPTAAETPQDLWRQKAAKLVDHAHQQLLDNPAKLNYLAGRGLERAAVEEHQLGWIDQDLFRERTSWGLPEDHHTSGPRAGRPKKLLIPAGIVIPYFDAQGVHRIRIRREQGQPRYYWLPGSGNDVIVLNPERRGFVVVESDLDAMLINWTAGDLVGVVPLGTCTTRPRQSAAAILKKAQCILIALDHDKAGAKNWTWWHEIYPQAERWPSVEGKDPGEDYQAGVDLRQWIVQGLPPGLRVAAMTIDHKPDSPVGKDGAGEGRCSATGSVEVYFKDEALYNKALNNASTTIPHEPIQPAPDSPIIRGVSAKGKPYIIATNRKAASALQAAGETDPIFTWHEVDCLSGMDPAIADHFITLKQEFPGCEIVKTRHIKPRQETKP